MRGDWQRGFGSFLGRDSGKKRPYKERGFTDTWVIDEQGFQPSNSFRISAKGSVEAISNHRFTSGSFE